PLVRFTLVRLAANRHLMILTSHHVLMDGWSTPIFFEELLALYRNGGRSELLPAIRPYRDYLTWLAAQDPQAAIAAWKACLDGVDKATCIAPAGEASGHAERWQRDLSPEFTSRLQAMARQRRLTLSNVIQGVWAVLLARVTG